MNERYDEEIGNLFIRTNTAMIAGTPLFKAIDMALEMAHKKEEALNIPAKVKAGRKAELMLERHKATILELRLQGYGYGAMAKMLAKKNIYNKKTGKAFSRHTIKNALITLQKEKIDAMDNILLRK